MDGITGSYGTKAIKKEGDRSMAVPYINLDKCKYEQIFQPIRSNATLFDVRFLPDSKHFLSLSNKNYLVKFSIESFSEVSRFYTDEALCSKYIMCIRNYVYVPYGDRVVVIDNDGVIYVFDIATCVCMAKMDFPGRSKDFNLYHRSVSLSYYLNYVSIFVEGCEHALIVNLDNMNVAHTVPIKNTCYIGMHIIDHHTAFMVRKKYGGLDVCDLCDGTVLQHLDIATEIGYMVADRESGCYYVSSDNGIFEISAYETSTDKREFFISRYMQSVVGGSPKRVVICRNDSGVKFIASMCREKAYVYSIDGQVLDMHLIIEPIAGTVNWSISPDFSYLVILTTSKDYKGSIMHVARIRDLLQIANQAR
jgi:WD40 repeat protein